MNKHDMAVLTTALTAALALAAPLAHADDYISPTDERLRLSLGVMRVSTTTDLQLDSSAGVPGTPLSAEDDLGLAAANFEPKFQAMVRVGERNRLRFDYFSLDRTGEATVTGAPIVFRNVIFQVGDPVQTDMSLRTLGISYEYSFVHREKFELAATIGINDTDLSTRANVSTQFRHVEQREDEAGPLPTIGLDATYVISKRFYLDARVQYFKIAIDHDNGSLGFFEVDALYRLRANVSFALGYTAARADVDSRQPTNSGYFDFDSKGPEFFVRVAF
jgi:hypothetical protein